MFVSWMGTKIVDCRSSFLSAAECLDVSERGREDGEVYASVCVCVCVEFKYFLLQP